MLENRNTILAVILSGLVLIAWQYFYNIPQMEKQRAQQQAQAELQKSKPPEAPATPASRPPQEGQAPQAGQVPPTAPAAAAPAIVSPDTAIAANPRVN